MNSRSILLTLILLCAGTHAASAEETWQAALKSLPWPVEQRLLTRTNTVQETLKAFQPRGPVKSLVWMPGATDEFYFFKRARATVSTARPTLLDAIEALTNQTFIRATFRPPMLILHTMEDPLDPVINADDKTIDRLKKSMFRKKVVYYDRDWNYVWPTLAFEFNVILLPIGKSYDSNHFYRHSLAAYGLTQWEALLAISRADKTSVEIDGRKMLFTGDERIREKINPTPTFTETFPDFQTNDFINGDSSSPAEQKTPH